MSDGAKIVNEGAILARWPGRCPFCARPIERGDLIVHVAGQWLHNDCDAAARRDDEDGGP